MTDRQAIALYKQWQKTARISPHRRFYVGDVCGRLFVQPLKSKHMTFTLQRLQLNGNALRGRLIAPTLTGAIALAETLENADKRIPCGRYELRNTLSPRFKKILPLIMGVPGRFGIRIHTGSKPEHSQGCILVNNQAKQEIIKLIDINTASNVKTYIDICDCTQGTEHLPWDNVPDSPAPCAS